MSRLVLALTALMICSPAHADEVTSCEERNVTLNQVLAMRPFAQGSVKLFSIDQEEPAASPAGVAVAIDRGDDLATAESFCRYVGGLSSVDLSKANARFDQAKATLTVKVPVRRSSGDGETFSRGTLTIVIRKGAAKEEDLVTASVQ